MNSGRRTCDAPRSRASKARLVGLIVVLILGVWLSSPGIAAAPLSAPASSASLESPSAQVQAEAPSPAASGHALSEAGCVVLLCGLAALGCAVLIGVLVTLRGPRAGPLPPRHGRTAQAPTLVSVRTARTRLMMIGVLRI